MAGNRIIEGAKEMLAVAKGEQPAALIHIGGHAYVSETALAAAREKVERLEAEKEADHRRWTKALLQAQEWRNRALKAEAALAAEQEACAMVADRDPHGVAWIDAAGLAALHRGTYAEVRSYNCQRLGDIPFARIRDIRARTGGRDE